MSFSTQPNEILDMILNQTGIPLPQRILLRAVSPRFNATLVDGLLLEPSLVIRVVNRGDLKKVNSGHSKVQPNDLLLKESHFTKKQKSGLDFIQRLFPQATDLSLHSDSLIAWRKLVNFLRLYSPTLTSLKVDGYLANPSTRESVFRSLPQAINSIANLSSLYLENEKQYYTIFQPSIGHHILHHLGPTLSRLERFTLEKPILGVHAAFLAASLSTRCTHLRLNLANTEVTTFSLLNTNLTHLHLEHVPESFLHFGIRLPRLTSLILHVEKESELAPLLLKIRPLSQLSQVTLLGIVCSRPLEPPASNAFAFPAIKRLTLQLVDSFESYHFNAQDYLSALATWFPSLSTCALHCPVEYREGILAIEEGALPFTVKLLDNLVHTF